MTVAGFTSTGSKRPEALYGAQRNGVPRRMMSSNGCLVRGSDGREYLDFIMALGAVVLGYGHPEVNRAVIDAVERGTIGPLSPVDEEALAADLANLMPRLEAVRFLKTGAEAVAAAVRIARVATGREYVLGCGYHGWLDWCSSANGVPAAVRELYREIPFNDAERTTTLIRASANRLACVVIEPVVDTAPDAAWLRVLREETSRAGAVLIFDEIKTAFRVAIGGAAERWGVFPDLTVLGKALANGYPLAAVGGSRALMQHVSDTWISSTMATEFVSLAAARATLGVLRSENVSAHLATTGAQLFAGLQRLSAQQGEGITRVGGVPEMCCLQFDTEELSQRVAVGCAERGLLWKRNAYNFVSLAHDSTTVNRALTILGEVLASC